MEIGLKIKELRLQNSLTQEELADRCELTKGYISQLENDLTSPSIAALTDILTSLGSSLTEFFSDVEEEKLVFTSDEQFEKVTEESIVKWLVPTSQKNSMEPILMELKSGAVSGKDLPHDGEEFGLVLEGEIKLIVGKQSDICKAGESFYFRSKKTHYIENIGKITAKIVWISSPPNF